VQDHLPFRRAIGTSISEGEADGGGLGPSIGEGIAEIGSEARTFGR